MYKYPSGLMCDATPLRVALFENIICPTIVSLLFLGSFAIAITIITSAGNRLLNLIFGLGIGFVAWPLICMAVLFLMFDLLLKPKPANYPGQKTSIFKRNVKEVTNN
jgi:hypothetical protein